MKVYNGDATLESIAVMAQAQSEETTPPPKTKSAHVWRVIEGETCTRNDGTPGTPMNCLYESSAPHNAVECSSGSRKCY